MAITFAGIVDGPEEYDAVLAAIETGWHGSGKISQLFEEEFAGYLRANYALLVNSGSSANLLALKALDLPPESRVLTSGCGFPTTLNPILILGLEPVLVDYDLASQNIDLDQIEQMASQIQAMIVAHTMGNPVDMPRLMRIASAHGIKVIEDACESLGSTINGQQVGTFGDVGTFSFYPSHHINGLGSGGCVVTNSEEIAVRARSLRNWGKLARSPSFAGDHVTEYSNEIDGIPYDDQYTYQTVGFNFQANDIQAAYLREQLKRLPGFIARRKENWEMLNQSITGSEIQTAEILPGAEPSFFSYPMILVGSLKGQRDHFSGYLEKHAIRTRPYLAGNITRHLPYRHLYQELPVADYLMRHGLWIGVWPGLSLDQMAYVAETINAY
jgi:CDP-4-dehydro-6-deoxyglucose reductase, E1